MTSVHVSIIRYSRSFASVIRRFFGSKRFLVSASPAAPFLSSYLFISSPLMPLGSHTLSYMLLFPILLTCAAWFLIICRVSGVPWKSAAAVRKHFKIK